MTERVLIPIILLCFSANAGLLWLCIKHLQTLLLRPAAGAVIQAGNGGVLRVDGDLRSKMGLPELAKEYRDRLRETQVYEAVIAKTRANGTCLLCALDKTHHATCPLQDFDEFSTKWPHERQRKSQ